MTDLWLAGAEGWVLGVLSWLGIEVAAYEIRARRGGAGHE